jgi:hypothetical protein
MGPHGAPILGFAPAWSETNRDLTGHPPPGTSDTHATHSHLLLGFGCSKSLPRTLPTNRDRGIVSSAAV